MLNLAHVVRYGFNLRDLFYDNIKDHINQIYKELSIKIAEGTYASGCQLNREDFLIGEYDLLYEVADSLLKYGVTYNEDDNVVVFYIDV